MAGKQLHTFQQPDLVYESLVAVCATFCKSAQCVRLTELGQERRHSSPTYESPKPQPAFYPEGNHLRKCASASEHPHGAQEDRITELEYEPGDDCLVTQSTTPEEKKSLQISLIHPDIDF